MEDLEFLKKSEKELTHFSEEGIADMDIPDHLLEELDFLDNITSCDKVKDDITITITITITISTPIRSCSIRLLRWYFIAPTLFGRWRTT